MLKGERIYLRPLEDRDVTDRVRWFNDVTVGEMLCVEDWPLSEVGTRQWLQRAALDNSRKDFMICCNADDCPIGCIGLRSIDWRHSKAETYLAIGETAFWGSGYGKEAQQLLLEYAFTRLRLNRLYSYSLDGNDRMIRLNQSLGFQIEGTLRDDVVDRGEFRSRVITGITAAAYEARLRQNRAA
jgi:RimJ/RimL family protein N-acetyltransferase